MPKRLVTMLVACCAGLLAVADTNSLHFEDLSWPPSSSEGTAQAIAAPGARASADGVYVPSSYVESTTYKATFTSAEGKTIEALVIRNKSVESIPYSVDYSLRLPEGLRCYAYSTSGRYPVTSLEEAGRVPALVIDDFSDADFISYLGTPWRYPFVAPATGVWGPTRDELGYSLVLIHNFSASGFSSTEGVELPLPETDASKWGGLYMTIRGHRENRMAVRLNEITSSVIPEIHGDWRETGAGEAQVFFLPFETFLGLDTRRLVALSLELLDRQGNCGYLVYEVGFYSSIEVAAEPPGEGGVFRTEFLWTSNAIEKKVTMVILDESNRIYTYTETLEFPLHSQTAIALGDQAASSGSASAEAWRAQNADPSDDSLRIEQGGGLRVLVSEYPGTLTVSRQVTPATETGSSYKAILYWRDGTSFAVRGCAISSYYRSGESSVAAFRDQAVQILDLGFNWLSIGTHYFYAPDDYYSQDYHLGPIYTKVTAGPPTIPAAELGQWIDLAHELGFKVMLRYAMSPATADPKVAAAAGAFSIKPSQGFFKPGGEEGGYFRYMLEAAQFAESHHVELLLIGMELVDLEQPSARPYWEELITQIRSVYSGELTYEVYVGSYDYQHLAGMWPWDKRYGMPFALLDYCGADEYRPISVDPNVSTEALYENIMGGVRAGEKGFSIDVAGDVRKMTAAYRLPYLVAEMGFLNCEGSTTTYDQDWMGTPGVRRDDEEARRAWTAYLRAMADLIDEGVPYAGLFVWEWPIMPDRDFYTQDQWWLINYNIRGIPPLFETFMAYFTDRPIKR